MTVVYVTTGDDLLRAEFDGECILVDGEPVPRRMVAVLFWNSARDCVEAHQAARQVQAAGYSCFVRRGRRRPDEEDVLEVARPCPTDPATAWN
jgi:hypothetical protein